MNEGWNDMAAADPFAGEDLERVLARYARVRLDPSPAQARRTRAAVMELAVRRGPGPGPVSTSRRRLGGRDLRRLGVSLSAAVLAGLVVGATAFATTRAGGPLYEVRLALEDVALPADPAARVDAELATAQARLAEAVEASGRGDGPAVVAALAAYERRIDDLATAQGDAADRALRAIGLHHAVLVDIAGTVPAAAAAGLDRALANSERVMDRLAAGGADGRPGNGGGDRDGDAGGGGGGGGDNPGRPTGAPGERPDGTAKPARTKDPAATSKPARTQAPDPTAADTPAPTARPGRTPPPRRTPDPEKPGGGGREPSPTKRP